METFFQGGGLVSIAPSGLPLPPQLRLLFSGECVVATLAGWHQVAPPPVASKLRVVRGLVWWGFVQLVPWEQSFLIRDATSVNFG